MNNDDIDTILNYYDVREAEAKRQEKIRKENEKFKAKDNEIVALKSKIQELETKNEELTYAPGSNEYHNAKSHFEKIVSK